MLSGTPATQTFQLDGAPQIAVGVPIPSVHAAYFEVFDVSDLSDTLRVLALALVAAGLVTTLLGAAVGRSASGRSLRPLTGVSRAAVAIAGGQLDTRLPGATGDPDLAGLTSSFNRMVDQLQERIEREARFTSDVSHELRSPLTTLSATLGVLEAHRDELSAPGPPGPVLLGADLRRFQRMVGDLLEISRSDTGSADVSLEEVSAGELVRRSVAASSRALPGGRAARRWSRSTPAVGRRLARRGQAPVRAGDGQPARERRPLRRRGHHGPGRAGTGPRRRPGHHLGVGRGPRAGLSPTERSRVFERFYRGQASGQRGAGTGTGLGLALVAEHVRLNGGLGLGRGGGRRRGPLHRRAARSRTRASW